jgi:hypothetical protein
MEALTERTLAFLARSYLTVLALALVALAFLLYLYFARKPLEFFASGPKKEGSAAAVLAHAEIARTG